MHGAFPKGTEKLAELVRSVTIDIPAFAKMLQPCELSTCRGTCCHDGVYLTGEEANVIRELVESEGEELKEIGAELPEKVVVYGRFRDLVSGPKTAVRPAPMRQWVADYPQHFAETNCVFLLPDARCALQALAMQKGLDPWHYKPFTCWIHPLSFGKTGDGTDILTLHDRETDPHNFPDFPGFTSRTHCGRECQTGAGKPAYEVVAPELIRLSEIGQRDLLGEIRAGLEK